MPLPACLVPNIHAVAAHEVFGIQPDVLFAVLGESQVKGGRTLQRGCDRRRAVDTRYPQARGAQGRQRRLLGLRLRLGCRRGPCDSSAAPANQSARAAQRPGCNGQGRLEDHLAGQVHGLDGRPVHIHLSHLEPFVVVEAQHPLPKVGVRRASLRPEGLAAERAVSCGCHVTRITAKLRGPLRQYAKRRRPHQGGVEGHFQVNYQPQTA